MYMIAAATAIAFQGEERRERGKEGDGSLSRLRIYMYSMLPSSPLLVYRGRMEEKGEKKEGEYGRSLKYLSLPKGVRF